MKGSEVQIGGVYLTKVGADLIPVRVLDRHPGDRIFSRSGRKPADTFVVARLDGNGRALPKNRTAAALHPLAPARPSSPEPCDSVPFVRDDRPMTTGELVVAAVVRQPLSTLEIPGSSPFRGLAYRRAWDRSADYPKLPGVQSFTLALERQQAFVRRRSELEQVSPHDFATRCVTL